MDTNSGTPPESQAQPSPHVESTPRNKRDPAWKHTTEIKGVDGKIAYTCNFCQKTFNGGGITRMKQHLAGVKGHVLACKKVTGEVRYKMKCSLQENTKKANERHIAVASSSETEVTVDGDHDNPEMTNLTLGKRKAPASSNLQSYFKLGMNDPSQPSIKASMQSKERWHDTDLAVCMWLYDACIPLNAINSPFFAIAMSKVASMGHGYYGPSYHAARVTLLKDAKASVKLIIDNHTKRIHTKRRNRLEHERLNDLVYVHYNLRLQNRGKQKRIYDPIDYESIDKTEDWIVEDAPEKELDYDDIENMLDEHPPINNESTGDESNDDDVVGEGVDLTSYERSIGLPLTLL